jgi:endonuclease/exonuclease/phosphatase family metal-dependent hydrolase
VRAWSLRAQVTLPEGQIVELYNVHLVPPASASTLEQGLTWGFRTREAQLRVIEREIESRGFPALIVGDHNFSDASATYRIATENWTDAWMSGGQGVSWTWPTRHFPTPAVPWNPRMLRLDYCFYTRHLQALEMRVLTKRTGSDHCPILITIAEYRNAECGMRNAE